MYSECCRKAEDIVVMDGVYVRRASTGEAKVQFVEEYYKPNLAEHSFTELARTIRDTNVPFIAAFAIQMLLRYISIDV